MILKLQEAKSKLIEEGLKVTAVKLAEFSGISISSVYKYKEFLK